MFIKDMFNSQKIVVSFEIFPPKKDSSINSVLTTIDELSKLKPHYISVTYSAGGSGNKLTAELARLIKNNYHIEPLAHLTCINNTKTQIISELELLKKYDIDNILTLRGDKILGSENYDFHYASDLINFINSNNFNFKKSFNLVGACYPDGHIESKSLEDDLYYLKQKVDLGLSHLITQLFFENQSFYNFKEKCLKNQINIPLQAGIMPIVKKSQVDRILNLTGVKAPKELSRLTQLYYNDEVSLFEAGIDFAIKQILDLIKNNVNGIHLYVMNNQEVAKRILDAIKNYL